MFFFVPGCSGLFDVSLAYNQADVNSNRAAEQEDYISTREATADSFHNQALPLLTDTLEKAGAITSDKEKKSGDFIDKIIVPSANSLSAIGTLFFFKNTIGKIFVAIGLSISVVLLVFYRLLKARKLQKFLLAVATTAVLAFIADAWLVDVTLLWGVWTLLAILILQLILEMKITTTGTQ